ncbi:MAG: MBL fold metallo-hydrolase [Candidatus Methanospirareceae archaeon]
MYRLEDLYIIKEGEVVREGDVIKYASSSVVLIRLKRGFAVLVDTGLKEDYALIRKNIEKIGLLEEVKAIVNTHLHIDHMGCNAFFHCKKYAHPLEIEMRGGSGSNEYISYEEFPKSEKVEIIETPGHCYGHISVVYKGEKTIVIAGDAIPKRGNLIQKIPPRIHVDRKKAIESIKKIEKIADVIIPGHDSLIEVKKRD